MLHPYRRTFPPHRARAILAGVTLGLIVVTLAGMAGCGGGADDTPQATVLATGTSDAIGGRDDFAASATLVPLPGPDVTLAQAGPVDIDVTIDWSQRVSGPAALTVALQVGDSGAVDLQPAAVVTQAGDVRWTTVHHLRLVLPAGTSSLMGTARLAATDSHGTPVRVINSLTAHAIWRITSTGGAQ